MRVFFILFKEDIIDEVYYAKSGHPRGSLSIADILTALYFREMNINPEKTNWEERDLFVLSKGHCSLALYSCLANRGFFPIEDLRTFRNIKSFKYNYVDKLLHYLQYMYIKKINYYEKNKK